MSSSIELNIIDTYPATLESDGYGVTGKISFYCIRDDFSTAFLPSSRRSSSLFLSKCPIPGIRRFQGNGQARGAGRIVGTEIFYEALRQTDYNLVIKLALNFFRPPKIVVKKPIFHANQGKIFPNALKQY